MKLILTLLALTGLFAKPITTQPYSIYDGEDEVVITTTEEEAVTTTEEQPAEVEKAEVESRDIQQIVTELAENYLGQYLDKQLIADIIAVAFGVIGYVALIWTNIKYGKYRKDTTEATSGTIKKELQENLVKAFTQLAQEQIKPLIEQNKELKEGYETIMKVLVLMQDASTKGKVALIDYLGSKTKSEEIKQTSDKVVEELKQNEETKAEINSKVSGSYEEIF